MKRTSRSEMHRILSMQPESLIQKIETLEEDNHRLTIALLTAIDHKWRCSKVLDRTFACDCGLDIRKEALAR